MYTLIHALQRISLLRKKSHVFVHRSTRLLRGFGVQFYVKPDPRCYVRIGEHGMLNAKIVFESSQGSVEIGNRVYIGAGTTIISREKVSIGNDVTMAWGITIYDHNSHSLDWRQRAKVVDHFRGSYGTPRCFGDLDWTGVDSAPIRIDDKAWIGFDVIVLKGVVIGEGAIIAAGSVVSKDVEPYTVVAGNPARVVKTLARNE